ncbi:eukaryotic translation initiation factor 3 subunit J [Monosporozyma unispora]|nr:Translation initiation factor 3 subunit J component [Kazachstania unispora]
MSWDNEAISGSNGNDDALLMGSWDDDAPAMDSWDAPEEPVKKEEPKPKPASKKNHGKKANGKDSVNKTLMDLDTLDEGTRKELLKKAELESDLNNAADLFGSLGVAEEHPRERAARKQKEEQDLLLSKIPVLTKDTPIENHPLFQTAETKSDYQNLRKALGTAIVSMHEKSALLYSGNLAIDLIRDISKPMSIEQIRQTVATLNVLIKDKERQERQARLAKVRGGTATGGAGKKKAKGTKTNLGGAFKKDQEFDLDNVSYDDFGDDDFM